MATAFPVSPTDGQQATVNNIVYQYASSTQSWTRVLTGVYQIGNGTSSMAFATANGNATVSIAGTSNVVVFASNGMYSANVIVPNQDQVVAYIFAF